jgi:hypothetical protein
MKLEKLVKHEAALVALENLELTDPQKAWDISVSIDTVKEHLKKFGEKRDELIKKIGKPVEGSPDQFQVEDDKIKDLEVELEKLLSVNVAIKFPKITLKELNGSKLSAGNASAWRDLCILTKK